VEEDQWRTDDMALAAFLLVEFGEDPFLVWEMSSCYFVFKEPDDVFLEAVQDFFSGKATIEPRKYNMAFAKLKKAVFSHPDAPKSPAWRKQRDTA
jgi:hypothetical protein